MAMNRHVSLCITELTGGGYVLLNGADLEAEPVTAVTTLHEASNAAVKMIEQALRPQEAKDEDVSYDFPKVIHKSSAEIIRPNVFKRMLGVS